ncbi:hypothetical protein RI129_008730 [Pyrocoelia pectoralis]|uniref:Uncharacterized protein n=1 Tax=Pyrocoelia pectoralis TaxID=417401 RepID=A0AAN7ZKE3_9COLE
MVNILDYNSDDNTYSKNSTSTKKHKSEDFKLHVKGIKEVVKNLELSVGESDLEDRQLLRQVQVDNIKNFGMVAQLSEARKENKQLLNLLHQKYEQNSSRSHSDFSTTCSTMSMVNLQYKYEELLNNHEGLLRLLSSKDKEVKRLCKENEDIIQNTSEVSKKLIMYESLLKKLCTKYLALKEKKQLQINKLKNEKATLLMAHNQLVTLLNDRYMDSDDLLTQYLHKTVEPQYALLLKEVRRANTLQHTNLLLKQEITFLRISKQHFSSNCDTCNTKIGK